MLEQEGREAAPRYPVVSVLDPVRAERARIASIQGDHEAVLDWVGTGSEHHPAYVREAEDLARTANQLQELVMRFHAEVGTDAAIEAAYANDGDEYDAVVPRRRQDDWGTVETGHGYASRAS